MNRTVPSTCSVFPCITGGTRASTGFRTPRPSIPNPAYCFSEEAPNVGFLPTIRRLPRVRGPAPPTCLLLLRRSNESRFPSHHTKTAHDLYFPALPRACEGVQVFSTFRPQMFQNLYSPASAAQHPQPCLLLPRRSNECRFPSRHTKTAHDLYSPALPRVRGGVQVFSTQMS